MDNHSTTLSDASKTTYELKTIAIIDATSGATLPTANYTTTTAGVVTFTDETAAGTTDVNISSTYTYDATNKAETALTAWITGLGDFADWIAIIVVVIAAAIILGIVMSNFGRRVGV